MKFQIGAMSVGDILDRGLKLLLARLPTFFLINFLVDLPILIIQLVFPVYIIQDPIIWILAGSVIIGVVRLIISPFGIAASLHVVAQEFADRHVGIGEAFRVGLARFGTLLLASIMAGLLISLGSACCLVPGLIFLSWYGLSSQVVVVEGLGASASLARSKELSEGYRGRVLGVFILLQTLLAILVFGVAVVIEMFLPSTTIVQTQAGPRFFFNPVNQSINAILLFPVEVLVASYLAVCTTLLYFDLRIRKEGYDLELASKQQTATPS